MIEIHGVILFSNSTLEYYVRSLTNNLKTFLKLTKVESCDDGADMSLSSNTITQISQLSSNSCLHRMSRKFRGHSVHNVRDDLIEFQRSADMYSLQHDLCPGLILGVVTPRTCVYSSVEFEFSVRNVRVLMFE